LTSNATRLNDELASIKAVARANAPASPELVWKQVAGSWIGSSRIMRVVRCGRLERVEKSVVSFASKV
jgi:hypothetical protein